MKRLDLFFSFLLVPIDYLMIIFAGLAVYFLRYETFLTAVRPVVFELPLADYLRILALVALLWLPIFALAGLYSLQSNIRYSQEFGRVFLACSAGLGAIVFFIFFRHELFGSRFIVLFGWLASIVFVFLGRIMVRRVQRGFFRRGRGVKKVVIIGGGCHGENFVNSLKSDSRLGFAVIRHLQKLDDAGRGFLANIAKKKEADLIIHADPAAPRDELLQLWKFCQENHLDFSYVADTLEAKAKNVEIAELSGMPLVQIKRTPLDGWGKIVKTIFDYSFSLLVLIFSLPASLFIALAIKLDSAGPVLVALPRVGEKDKIFRLYKFRSMVAGAEALKENLRQLNERQGPLFKMKNDPRVTRVGRFLRKYSLDELPNFINVLKGETSVVGPRPHEPGEVSLYSGKERRLLNIKPGVTGLAQTAGRSVLDFSEEARLDLFYIENWSLWLDMQIILRTIKVVFTGKNAA